jgi:cysteine-rich repeat protein
VRLVLAAAPALLVVSACPSLDPFTCQGDDQCTLAADGVCHEDEGACSYPDDTCPSGRRWSQTAGALADQCVEEAPAECGNGVVEGDEECDDGNAHDCNACTADCHLAGQLRWSVTYDGMGWADFFDSAVVDSSGDVIVVGRTSSGTEEADKDRVVVRYTAEGELRWATTEPRDGRDDLNCVVLTPEGEILAAGMRISDADEEELWVGRYDDGLVEDRLTYGTLQPLPTQAQGCVLTTDGRLVVVGMIEGEGAGFEKWDRLVLRDALGAAPEAVAIADDIAMPGTRDIAYDVVAAPDAGFLVGGNVTRDLDLASERWLVRFDAAGLAGPDYVDGGPGQGQEEVLGVVFRDGKVFAAGTKVINEGNTEQTWIARLGYEDLALEWEVDLGLPPAALVTGMTLDAAGNPLVVVDIEGDEATLDDDGTVLAALDAATGECLWLVEDPGDLGRAGGIAVAPDGSVIVVGADASTDEPATNALVASLSP